MIPEVIAQEPASPNMTLSAQSEYGEESEYG
jgi:hypothetical protein